MYLMNKIYTSSKLPSVTYPGQLWFDESINELKVFDGTTFQPLNYFDYNIAIPSDIDISTLTSPTTLQLNQRAYFNVSGNTIDLSNIALINKGYESYRIDITVFTKTTFRGFELDPGFGSTRVNLTLLTGASVPSSLYFNGSSIAYRGQSVSSYTRTTKNTSKFEVVPISHGMSCPISGSIFVMYRGYNDKRSLHFDIRGQQNFLLGSIQALSNGNPWNSIGTFQIYTDASITGFVLVTRIV